MLVMTKLKSCRYVKYRNLEMDDVRAHKLDGHPSNELIGRTLGLIA